MAAPSLKYIHLRFEVTGKVQQVFFRKCTYDQATKLKLVGWVQNTKRKTVIGEAQGTKEQIEEMKQWLEVDASQIPFGKGSKIHVKEAKFEETNIDKINFEQFIVDRKAKFQDFTLFGK
eukprot:899717_1